MGNSELFVISINEIGVVVRNISKLVEVSIWLRLVVIELLSMIVSVEFVNDISLKLTSISEVLYCKSVDLYVDKTDVEVVVVA